jgi:hypothetical protein
VAAAVAVAVAVVVNAQYHFAIDGVFSVSKSVHFRRWSSFITEFSSLHKTHTGDG